jgi:predicted Zn-dependent protease
LFDAPAASDMPLTADASRALAERVMGLVSAPEAIVTVESACTGSTTIASGQLDESSDTRYISIGVLTAYGRRSAEVTTDRLDDVALSAAVAKAEALAQAERLVEDVPPDPPGAAGPVNAALWHDETLAILDPTRRVELALKVRDAVSSAGTAGGGRLVGGGVVGMSARAVAVLTKAGGHFEYGRTSTATCSVSARTTDGTGSGWASWKGEDWAWVDPVALAAQASDVARHTRYPVAVEPGAYTVVLSPVALAELVGAIAYWGALDARAADQGRSPFARKGLGNTAVGERVFDERVTLSADPMDPDGGFLPFAVRGRAVEQYRAVTWVRNGVLETLAYDAAYARVRGRPVVANAGALRMSGGGGALSAAQMIASVDRGIYVTRLSQLSLLSLRGFLMTGVTRDGTFLIERGTITRAVRNLRFQDSPIRMLNALAVIGVPERVPVGGGAPLVMPGAVVRDFAFTGIE